MTGADQQNLEVVEIDWMKCFDDTQEHLRELVREVIRGQAAALAAMFYERMLLDPEARPFLSHEVVQGRLLGSMGRWLETLFASNDRESFGRAMALQRHVGEVHARIDLPVNIVARGARVLKGGIARALLDSRLGRDELVEAVLYVGTLIDLAFEVMSSAYVDSHESAARVDEAYRVFSYGQNMSLEKERQRSALLDWENQFFFAVATHQDGESLPVLSDSSFGLWLQHKAMAIFQGASEIEAIFSSMSRVDRILIPCCADLLKRGDKEEIRRYVRDVQTELSQLKFLLGNLFERFVDLESGKDPLTQLLNRRFLPAILSREIELARTLGKGFALLLIDIDHFKQINDQHGHDAGDRMLQQCATLLLNNVRSGDFLFRYGGEEFLALLVEVDALHAIRVAEKIRSRVAVEPLLLPNGGTLNVTISIGVALHDGHPDYQRLVNRADEALYRAKKEGRNRCVKAA